MAGLELLSDQGFRIDGRRPSELRRIQCRLGVFSQADGSAYLEQGNTKVLAAVYGPHEPSGNMRSQILSDKAFINCEYSQATFSTAERKHRSRGDRKGQELSMHIKQTFEAAILTDLYPRSQIDIYLQVLHSDGGNYCVCVNAATLALIDAGISIKDYVCSCSVSVINGTPLNDVNRVEENANCPELVAAMLPKLDEIIYIEQNGRVLINLTCIYDISSTPLQYGGNRPPTGRSTLACSGYMRTKWVKQLTLLGLVARMCLLFWTTRFRTMYGN